VVHSFTISNSNTLDLVLSGTPALTLSGDGADHFQVLSQPETTIPGGGTTTFQIRYEPAALGMHQATVTIPNNDEDENPYTFAIRGLGTQPLFLPAIER
jgi:hypothetical protein